MKCSFCGVKATTEYRGKSYCFDCAGKRAKADNLLLNSDSVEAEMEAEAQRKREAAAGKVKKAYKKKERKKKESTYIEVYCV